MDLATQANLYSDRVTNHAKNDTNVLGFQSNKNC
jgi:hypothetical protein